MIRFLLPTCTLVLEKKKKGDEVALQWKGFELELEERRGGRGKPSEERERRAGEGGGRVREGSLGFLSLYRFFPF